MNATLVSGDVSAAHDDRPTVYLAAPFSHPDPAVRKVRFDAACQTAAALIRSGIHVFSPLSHSCAIALYGLPTDWSFWESFDRACWPLATNWSCCSSTAGVRAVACRPRSTWRSSWTCQFVTWILRASTRSSRERNERPRENAPRIAGRVLALAEVSCRRLRMATRIRIRPAARPA